MNKVFKLQVNNQTHHVEADPDTSLIYILRNDLGLKGIKLACGKEQCGACKVLVDGQAVPSCKLPVKDVVGMEVTTIEGLEREAAAFGKFMAAQGADQCGFCSPGLVMTILAMEKELDDPGPDQIRAYLAGNLCRCTGYAGQMRAIENYLKSDKGGGHEIR